jgi:Bacterial Ig domain
MRFAFTRFIALVSVVAVVLLALAPAASAQSAGWQPGPGAILDNTYTGFIDVPTNGATVAGSGSFTVAGWFVDMTAQGWAGADDVQVWLGTMDGGGRMLAKAVFAQSRPDVAAATGNPYWAASGFGAAVAGLPAGSQTLNVYAHTGGKGWWFKGVTVNGGGGAGAAAPAPSAPAGPVAGGAPVVVINSPTQNQNVSTKSLFSIEGTVSNPSSIDNIEVWINGERNSKYGSLLGSTTPASDGSWSLSFNPTKYPSTHSNLYVYAHSRNGQETVANREINIVDR